MSLHGRVVITGVARSGKTHRARQLSAKARGSDELLLLPKSDQSEEASRWLDQPGPWVLEGVMMLYALRRWLERNPKGKPADRVEFLNEFRLFPRPGHTRQAGEIRRAWPAVRNALRARGVPVVESSTHK